MGEIVSRAVDRAQIGRHQLANFQGLKTNRGERRIGRSMGRRTGRCIRHGVFLRTKSEGAPVAPRVAWLAQKIGRCVTTAQQRWNSKKRQRIWGAWGGKVP